MNRCFLSQCDLVFQFSTEVGCCCEDRAAYLSPHKFKHIPMQGTLKQTFLHIHKRYTPRWHFSCSAKTWHEFTLHNVLACAAGCSGCSESCERIHKMSNHKHWQPTRTRLFIVGRRLLITSDVTRRHSFTHIASSAVNLFVCNGLCMISELVVQS